MTRILGIDPGSRITGYGVIDSNGVASQHVASGCIRVDGDDFCARLGVIFQQVSEIITTYNPAEMAIEEVFFARNASSALKLGQARGAAICAAVTQGLTVSEYTPRAIKKAVVGSGGAEKEQVQYMVRLMLELTEKPASDQADALAVAISHAHTDATLSRVARNSRRRWR